MRTGQMPRFFGKTTMPKRTRDYNAWRLEKLADPQIAEGYLDDAVTGAPEMYQKALRNVARARQMASVAREASTQKRGNRFKKAKS